MKKPIIPAKLTVLLTFTACMSQKVQLEFPDAMIPQVRKEYTIRCNKGKVLYDLNCAGCHNQAIGKKTIIPDFDPQKLQGYAIRVSNARHETNMPDTLVSEEELVLISNFLTYKKKNRQLTNP